MIKPSRAIKQRNRVSVGQRIIVKDEKSLPGLIGILDADIDSELIDEIATLRLMKIAIRNRDCEGFARIDPYIKSFWDSAAVVDGCIVINDRNAIPICLQRAEFSRLNRSNSDHEAIEDTAQNLWLPRIHRDIVSLSKSSRECIKFGKKLKPMNPFIKYKSLSLLNAPNEEPQ